MGLLRTSYPVARADLLERIRQYSFLIMLGIAMMAAYFFVPPAEAGYVTLYFEEYRGVYNSAWIGGSVAISTTLFLGLFGFYLVKNSIQRDERSGVGQLIASTSIKKRHYLIGKWMSNFAVLSIIVGVIILVSIIMQVVRGEEMRIELWPLVSPFLILALPTMSVVAALAVLFETRQAWNGGWGNALYFALFIAYVLGSSNMPFGPTIIMSSMVKELASIHPGFTGSSSLGILVLDAPLKLFEWNGVEWTPAILLQQLSLLLVALLLLLAAALLFHGFRNSSGMERQRRQKSAEGLALAEPSIDLDHTSVDLGIDDGPLDSHASVSVSSLTPVTIRHSFLSLVYAEWRLMMKSASLGWYTVAGALFVLCLSFPVSTSQSMIWPLAWIWPLVLWSGMGCRETRYQTQYLVASSPRYATRQLLAVWGSGFVLACLSGGGMALRMIFEGDMAHFMDWSSAVLLIPSLSLASGVLTKSNRTFEVLYMIIWYLGPLN
ncbi:hypothetical protein [Gorillibacterium timonense]|uniref:hypothetical protein n=1 Tax=Gorillibacterium timonense TaxID=1689269 RepID=UPI00071D897D|nr:hypothetical protein [Gorillibacterium timonense]